MIVSINQPAYLPWLGYFDRIARSDLHIVLDTVQMERNTRTSYTNRNRVRTAQGPVWLTVPVKRPESNEQSLICNVLIDGYHWTRKHWSTLTQSYSRAPFFVPNRDILEPFFQREWIRLDDLLRETTACLLEILGVEVPLVRASTLGVEGTKGDLVLNLCRNVGATRYLSGPFGRDYLDIDAFAAAGIEVELHDYVHPVYPQIHGGFEPYMSVVDLLFNCGQNSLSILRSRQIEVSE